jgi:hypothetical protein
LREEFAEIDLGGPMFVRVLLMGLVAVGAVVVGASVTVNVDLDSAQTDFSHYWVRTTGGAVFFVLSVTS